MVNYLITHNWAFGPGDEIQMHSLVVQTDIADQAQVAQEAQDAFEAPFADPSVSIAGILSSDVTYNFTTAARIIDLSLGTLAAASTVFASAPPVEGTGDQNAAQVALAVSLNAGFRPNGQPLRGRFFLPTIAGQAFDADGRLSGVLQGIVRDFVQAWFGGLDAATLTPSVWSRSLATVQAVTGARIGNVPDTIRSRRNQLPESYVDVPAWGIVTP